MTAIQIEITEEPVRLDVLIAACMDHLGMTQAEAESEVRRVCGDMNITLTEIGHA